MNGVIILSTEQVASSYTFNWWAFAIAFVVVVLLALFLALIYDILDMVALYVIIGIFGVVGGVMFGFLCQIPIEYETQYKVTITSDVSMTEFYEHYEVVEQDGLIFTVKEKAND